MKSELLGNKLPSFLLQTELIAAMCKLSKEQKRVSANDGPVENEK